MALTRGNYHHQGFEPKTGVAEDYKEGGKPTKITDFCFPPIPNFPLDNGSTDPNEGPIVKPFHDWSLRPHCVFTTEPIETRITPVNELALMDLPSYILTTNDTPIERNWTTLGGEENDLPTPGLTTGNSNESLRLGLLTLTLLVTMKVIMSTQIDIIWNSQ